VLDSKCHGGTVRRWVGGETNARTSAIGTPTVTRTAGSVRAPRGRRTHGRSTPNLDRRCLFGRGNQVSGAAVRATNHSIWCSSDLARVQRPEGKHSVLKAYQADLAPITGLLPVHDGPWMFDELSSTSSSLPATSSPGAPLPSFGGRSF